MYLPSNQLTQLCKNDPQAIIKSVNSSLYVLSTDSHTRKVLDAQYSLPFCFHLLSLLLAVFLSSRVFHNTDLQRRLYSYCLSNPILQSKKWFRHLIVRCFFFLFTFSLVFTRFSLVFNESVSGQSQTRLSLLFRLIFSK